MRTNSLSLLKADSRRLTALVDSFVRRGTMVRGWLRPALPAGATADLSTVSTESVNQPVGPAGLTDVVRRMPRTAAKRVLRIADDCCRAAVFVSSLPLHVSVPVGKPFMSLLGAVIAWLLQGLLRRPAPALVRSACGRQLGRAVRPECAGSLFAWRYAAGDRALIWWWSDHAGWRLTQGSNCARRGAFRQGVRRR